MEPSSRFTSMSFQSISEPDTSSTLIILEPRVQQPMNAWAQDWDDTLFPTTWLESKKAGEHGAHPRGK